MSDPFADINQEVALEKFKRFFFKYKKSIFIFSIILVVLTSFTLFLIDKKKNKDIRLAGYLIEIISIINSDEDKAIKELNKLVKLDHVGHQILSNLLLSKIYLNKQDYSGALKYLKDIEIRDNKLETLNKLKNYFISVSYLGLSDKQNFEKSINLLLSYGDYWSLLGHELRGHFLFNEGNYKEASKDFTKILNEELSTQNQRQRSQEMLSNIKLVDEDIN